MIILDIDGNMKTILNILKTKFHRFLIGKFLRDSGLGKKDYVINKDLSIDIKTHVNLSKWTKIFDELPVQFNSVKGHFLIVNDFEGGKGNLKSMKGFPKTIGGNFSCVNQKLTNLKDGPDIVNGSYCVNNNIINELTWTPTKVRGYLDFSNNQISDFKNLDKFETGNTSSKDENKLQYHQRGLWVLPERFSLQTPIKINKKGNPIGRRVSVIDPYGEENWDE